MNREIKFRAWLIDEKKWYDVDITDSGSVGVLNINYKYELCQFTGLFDKNGKEIYEGDFVQNSAIEYAIKKDNDKPWLVEFDRGCFGCHRMALRAIIDIEIIGNLYENPELL
jgi:hypothetical protein